ncbi:FG-GAP-like repeat-containing protein [Streptomyces sp. NPDC059766]|uniref:FG-GAP-like repeat-containing protein n=1 Tax=Streptomyces sp. NPDC059766 TaxID=3346940 RepID=UPI0036487681
MRPTLRSRILSASLAAALSALSLSAAAPTAHADATAEASAPELPLDDARASAKAQATGKAVAVDAATTPTEAEVANPDGTFTLTQSVAPVRKYVSGSWKELDATLARHSDGTIGPAVTSTNLVLSDGGKGPLAVMKDQGRSLSLTVPASIGSLPAPTLNGASATYPDVLDGVDLKVTADTQGGFSEVLVVKSPEAAANPALDTLSFPAEAKNVALATDEAGNITAKSDGDRTVFAAPAPLMWDSATTEAAAPAARSMSKQTVSASDAGEPTASSTDEPGSAAHIAPVAASYTSGAIRLTPDADLLSASSTVFPVYIDPTYAAGGTLTSWTWVNSAYPSTSYWKDTSPTGMHVGYQGWETPYHKSRAYAKVAVDSRMFGAHITDSHFYATETYAPSCTATPVELWRSDPIDSNTTWDNQPTRREQWGSKTVAYGYSSSCPAQSLGFDVTDHMQDIADAGNLSNVTLRLEASEELDKYGWKKFDHATISMSTTYDHVPNKPSTLVTSPATTCTSAIKATGDGDVTLYAAVSDPDGGTLNNTFNVTKTSGSAQIAKPVVSAASGKNAAYILKKSVLEAAAGGSVLGVTWNVTSSDGTYSSPVSATCKFTFDPSRPGAPKVSDASSHNCSDDSSPVTYQVGSPATFKLAPNDSSGSTAGYLYQLNGATPLSVAQSGSESTTDISVTPTRGTNVLTVTALSAGGNIGDTANCILIAAPATTASDGDLTGDGVPDLTAVGAQAGLSSGLWLAHGTADGQLTTSATDLGAQGTGANSAGSPADWNGTQAITGHFNTGAGFNDVLNYNPATGSGSVLFGSGDGSALHPVSGSQMNVSSIAFTDTSGITGTIGSTATSVASGGDLYNTLGEWPTNGYPSLLMIVGGQLWDEPANPGPGAFGGIDSAQPLGSTNPTGSGDWTGWSITSSLIDGLPAMFARNNAIGSLYYYTPQDLINLASGSMVSPQQVASSGYTSAAVPILQAADLDGDVDGDGRDDDNHTPDLRTVSANGASTTRIFNAASNTLTAQSAQTLIAPSHTWPLSDASDGPAATAADTAAGLNLTGGTTAAWDTDDDASFSSNLALDGTASSAMTSTAALTVSTAFTLSAWVKPAATGGVVASQDGVHNSGFFLYPQSNKVWSFCMATSDTTRSNECIAGGSAIIGQWTHLTITYDPTTKAMTLYVDDRPVARGSHTAVSGFTGKFTLGNVLANDARGSFYRGNLAGVQVWNGVALTSVQVATMANVVLPKGPFAFADVADYNGGGNPDVVAADATGSLWLYPGNGNGGWSTSATYIGSSLTGYTYAGIGDFNNDGYADTVAMAPGGTLRLFPGDAGHDLLTPVTDISSGWSGYAFAGVADFNRDGKADLIARDTGGTLSLFPGKGTGASLDAPVQIGTGWSGFTFAGVADLNSDGNPDVIARDSDGILWLYPGNGSKGFGVRSQIGTGWNSYTFAGVADFNSDGNPDVIARDSAGVLWLYPRTATAFSTRQQIGTGW